MAARADRNGARARGHRAKKENRKKMQWNDGAGTDERAQGTRTNDHQARRQVQLILGLEFWGEGSHDGAVELLALCPPLL